MALIVDSSVVLAWALDTEANAMTRMALVKVIAEGFMAPHHLAIEVANGLLRAERHDRASRNKNDLFLLDFKKMDIQLDEPIDADRLDTIVTLGRQYMLSGYDAAYLELALRTRLPLATRDNALGEAIKKAGGVLFSPPP
jgi:predicted nucleic acid-binding protein